MWKTSPEYMDVPDFSKVRALLTTSVAPSDGALDLPETRPLSNQLRENSCAANATCDAFELVMSEPVDLARNFVYWNARRTRREEMLDQGTDLYACFHSATDIGVCEESLWPYDIGKVLDRPRIEAYERAYDNRLGTFYSLRPYGQTVLESINDALRTGYPVAFGLAVNSNDFRDYKGGDAVIESPSNTNGGHAMVIVGYRTVADGSLVYKFRNSWGTGWGNGGYGWISPMYLSSILYGAEFYVPVALLLSAP